MLVCFSLFLLLRRESTNTSRGHSSGQSVWDVCNSSEEGQPEVCSALELSVALSPFAMSYIYWESCLIFTKYLQALSGWWPNSAEPCGELWTPRGPVDSTRHHHHAPLCCVWRPTRLADPAQEPVTAEPVGGEMWNAWKNCTTWPSLKICFWHVCDQLK